MRTRRRTDCAGSAADPSGTCEEAAEQQHEAIPVKAISVEKDGTQVQHD